MIYSQGEVELILQTVAGAQGTPWRRDGGEGRKRLGGGGFIPDAAHLGPASPPASPRVSPASTCASSRV